MFIHLLDPSMDRLTHPLTACLGLMSGTERWEAYKAWSLTRKALTIGGAAFCYWYDAAAYIAHTAWATAKTRTASTRPYPTLTHPPILQPRGS